MAPTGGKNVALSLAAAGVGIVGASVVFGLTTESGSVDWVGVIMAAAGVIMILTGLIRVWRPGSPRTG